MQRADLERTGPDGGIQLLPVDLDALCGGAGELDILLEDGDRLIVYDREKIIRQPRVYIDGLIEHPGGYKLLRSMRLSDLIFRGGGLEKNAYLTQAEIARRRPDVPTQLIRVNLQDVLIRRDLTQDILLEEDDHIFIRENPAGARLPLVKITGEVQFPGKYALADPSTTLYELMQRAGGLTPYAFPQGTVFIRQSISEDIRRQGMEHILMQSQPIVQDSNGTYTSQALLQFNPEKMTRIILDVPSILKSSGGEDDITLQDGDQIYIPEIPSGVLVMGAVASAGTIKYHPGWKAGGYLKEAGGFTSVANKSAVRLIHANGQVLSGKPVIRQRVQLGDAIFVPPKIKRDKNWMPYITGVTAVLTSVATSWLLIDRIGD
jgi:protein involved in polysaccharide export with SLBB domain